MKCASISRPPWPRDSISRRFAIAVAASATVCILLNLLLDLAIGRPDFWPPEQLSLFDGVPAIVHALDAVAPDQRDALARSAATRAFAVAWQPPSLPAAASETSIILETIPNRLITRLHDGSALIFTPEIRGWSVSQPTQWLLRISIFGVSIVAASVVAASRLARPIAAFAEAARCFGNDPNARPITLQGPQELQQASAAFNAMQSQIQRFVAGQAAMFAAISHDLRTPLTRMRLRGEFIDDSDQQMRLFRDVDEMQSMVESVLVFLRDNAADEKTTRLDLVELLRSIADDYADIGTEVTYSGPQHLAFPGRPIGLRRAFGNLVDNAVKYGVRPSIDLQRRSNDVKVTITDRGPGIPDGALHDVFTPFQRLEPSRNRHTGGMGLGLASAQAGFRAHGGEITLANAETGGLRAIVILPLPPTSH